MALLALFQHQHVMMLSTAAGSGEFSTDWEALQMHLSNFVSKLVTQHHVANAQDLSCNAMQSLCHSKVR